MTHRVSQWARGAVARAATGGVISHPDLELIGRWVVYSAEKDGQDVGALVGRAPTGIAATRDIDALLEPTLTA